MDRQPATKQRSPWTPIDDNILGQFVEMAGVSCAGYQRRVHDGLLAALVAEEPLGWHMSISHRRTGKKPGPGRYPTWDEIAHARYELLPADIDFVMHLPPEDEYVALHDTTFHLHEFPEREAP